MNEGTVKVQGIGPLENAVEVLFTGDTEIAKGQIMCSDLTNGVMDEVKVLTANAPVAGVADKAYAAAAGGQLIRISRGKCVCDALVDGTQDVSVGDILLGDVSLGGFKSVVATGVVNGNAAIALEAYTDAGVALKKVMLLDELSLAVA